MFGYSNVSNHDLSTTNSKDENSVIFLTASCLLLPSLVTIHLFKLCRHS